MQMKLELILTRGCCFKVEYTEKGYKRFLLFMVYIEQTRWAPIQFFPSSTHTNTHRAFHSNTPRSVIFCIAIQQQKPHQRRRRRRRWRRKTRECEYTRRLAFPRTRLPHHRCITLTAAKNSPHLNRLVLSSEKAKSVLGSSVPSLKSALYCCSAAAS